MLRACDRIRPLILVRSPYSNDSRASWRRAGKSPIASEHTGREWVRPGMILPYGLPSWLQTLVSVVLVPVVWIVACCCHPGPQGADAVRGPMSRAEASAQRVRARLDGDVPAMLREHRVAGAGVAVIRDGKVLWTAYYGEQAAGVPVSARTVFNTASVAKTLTAETLIALAAKQLISLDEPIYSDVSEPDLDGDPRYRSLTARVLLSHRSGLLNWRYLYEDRRLRFIHDPGKQFSYSGFGIELAARYAEHKLGVDFERLAFEHVLAPLGITEMSMGRWKPWLGGRLAAPMDASGNYIATRESPYARPTGEPERWSAADDLLTTVDAYARLLIGVIENRATERTAILTSLAGDPIWNCEPTAEVVCAERYGHGLGWMVYEYAGKTFVKHGGNDQGENALVYYSPETKRGAVIFINGGNGIFVTVGILARLGDAPELADYYRQLVERHYKVVLPTVH